MASTPGFSPRPYQREAVRAVLDALAAGQTRPAVVLPTGAGKTVVFSQVIRDWIEWARYGRVRDPRVLVLAHRAELLEQAAEKIRAVCPDLKVGTVKAGVNQVYADVVVASTQTLASEKRRAAIKGVGLIIVDECFPAGTLVGGKPIESLRPGDMVPSWDEATGEEVSRPVVAPMRRIPNGMVRVTFDDGTKLHCTPNHPLMTTEGWCPAGALRRGASVLSFAHDATATGDVHGVRNLVPGDGESEDRRVAQVGSDVLPRRVPRRVGEPRRGAEDGPDEPGARAGADAGEQPHGAAGEQGEDGRDDPAHRARAEATRRQRSGDAGAAARPVGVSGLAHGSSGGHEDRRAAVSLQAGHSSPVDESRGRGGWGVPLLAGAPRVRPAQGRVAHFARVAGVQVLEPGRDGTYGGVCPDGAVYNIEVAGTHTYQVGDGMVAHNCHHATAATYRKILEHYQCPAVGFTATMSRGDDAALGDIWQDIVYKRDIAEMIRDGYLCGVRGVRVQVPDLDLRRVKRLAGDYSDAALGAALEGSLAPQLIAKAWREHVPDKQGLLFAPTVSSADVIAAELVAQGISAELVHGAMKTDDRAAALDRFRNGKVQVLANCMVLTEGTDLPMAEVIAVARPTTNQALYVQMVGRGLRLYPGKQRATVLDLVGATAKHSLMSPVKLFGEQLDALDKDVVELDPAELEEIELLREEEAGEAVGAGQVWIEGDLEAIEVDLFHGSASAWQRTHAGVWFLPAGDRFIALVRGEAGMGWDVVWMHKYRHGVSGWVARGMPDLGYAMATAEGNVQPGEELTTSRDRAWKAKAPSEKTVALAQRYGIEVHSLMRAGEVSALITLVEASRRIDPVQVARGLEKVGV